MVVYGRTHISTSVAYIMTDCKLWYISIYFINVDKALWRESGTKAMTTTRAMIKNNNGRQQQQQQQKKKQVKWEIIKQTK